MGKGQGYKEIEKGCVMVRVFLVEDEMLIREGIKHSIEWEKEGYEFVGEASDGELALPMILKEKPDILITDIRMPFMNGLELSKLVKQELPDIKILILSGYDDFEYAKEAIKIGVTEYLLKPISSAKLLETLQAVAKQIANEKEEKELREIYRQEMQENIELKKMKFFVKLLSGEMSLAEALERGRDFDMNLSAGIYQIILFKVRTIEPGKDKDSGEIYEAVEKMVKDFSYVNSFQRGVDGWAFLVTGNEEEELSERTEKLVQALHTLAKNYDNIEYFGGIGNPVFRLRELGNSFREADKAFASRFTRDMNQIVSVEELQLPQDNEEFETGIFGELEQTHRVVEKFLNNGAKEEVASFVAACLNEIPENNFKSLMMRQYVMMNIYVTVMSFCEKITKDAGKVLEEETLQKRGDELKKAIRTTNSKEDIKEYVEHLIEQVIEVRNAASGKRYSDIIHMAKEQIETTYMEEDISLNTVAAGVGMSPSYFSSIFSKEMGKTFVEYLTEIRIEKAKELLVCTSMKTSEVGYEVGYKDPHYFSYIFKKIQGCSPKDYRAERKGRE